MLLLDFVRMVRVWRIGIYLHGFVFSETYSELIGQQCIRYPSTPFYIQIESSLGVVINLLCRVIPVAVFGVVSMGGHMIGRPVRMSNFGLRSMGGFLGSPLIAGTTAC